MIRKRIPTATLAALIFSPLALAAQEGGVAGRVLDRSGDPVAGAELRLRCAGGEAARPFFADENGRFLARLPAAAECRLEARLPASESSGVELALAAGEAGPLELRLDVDLFVDRLEIVGSAPLTAVGARELRESLAHDVGEALARVAGVEKLRKGGIASDVVLRGQKGDNVAVRIDGQPLHGACPNRMDPATFHVDFAEVERIEVRKGPFDVATAGLAGAVVVETREPDPGLHYDVGAAAASAGYWAPSLTVARGGQRWSWQGGFAGRRGDPYRDGDGRAVTELLPLTASAAYRPESRDTRAFDVATGWLGASWLPRPGHRVELAATRQQADELLYPYLAMDGAFDDMTRLRAGYRFQGDSSALESVTASAGWSRVDHRMDDRHRVSAGSLPRPYSMATDADARDAALNVAVGLRAGWQLGLAAHRRDWRTTTWLAGRGYAPQTSLPDTRADAIAVHANRRDALTDRLTLELGGRVETVASDADPQLADTDLYDAYHATRATSADDLLLGASLGLTWQPSPAWELSARLGSVARAPDPQERWYGLRRLGSDWVGNPALDPARNTQLELGSRRRGERLTLDVSVWAAALDDAITLVDIARVREVPGVMNAHARSYVNHDARMWGVEATAMVPLGRAVVAVATSSSVRPARDPAPALGVVDRDLPEVPPPSARLAVRWEPGRWWLEGEAVAAARQDQVDSGVGETPTPGYALGNLRAGLALGRVQLVAGVDNLFDRTYREHLSFYRDPFRAGVRVPEPGRTWTGSVRFRH